MSTSSRLSRLYSRGLSAVSDRSRRAGTCGSSNFGAEVSASGVPVEPPVEPFRLALPPPVEVELSRAYVSPASELAAELSGLRSDVELAFLASSFLAAGDCAAALRGAVASWNGEFSEMRGDGEPRAISVGDGASLASSSDMPRAFDAPKLAAGRSNVKHPRSTELGVLDFSPLFSLSLPVGLPWSSPPAIDSIMCPIPTYFSPSPPVSRRDVSSSPNRSPRDSADMVRLILCPAEARARRTLGDGTRGTWTEPPPPPPRCSRERRDGTGGGPAFLLRRSRGGTLGPKNWTSESDEKGDRAPPPPSPPSPSGSDGSETSYDDVATRSSERRGRWYRFAESRDPGRWIFDEKVRRASSFMMLALLSLCSSLSSVCIVGILRCRCPSIFFELYRRARRPLPRIIRAPELGRRQLSIDVCL